MTLISVSGEAVPPASAQAVLSNRNDPFHRDKAYHRKTVVSTPAGSIFSSKHGKKLPDLLLLVSFHPLQPIVFSSSLCYDTACVKQFTHHLIFAHCAGKEEAA
jgi:hypothetical protein